MATRSRLTYKQAITMFNDFADAHAQINWFGSGSISDITENEDFEYTNYPVLFVVPTGTTHPDNTVEMSFNIHLLDVSHASNGMKAHTDILSDMLEVQLDLVAELIVAPKLFSDDVRMSIEIGNSLPIDRETEDNLTGQLTPVTLIQAINRNYCAIPKTA
jgi:hypothetical protein